MPPVLIAAFAARIGPGRSSPLADIGPAPRTVLVDSAGKPFDLASLKGKVVLVSFVYTTCTGVCPATTQAMVRVQKALEEAKLWGTRSSSSRSRSIPERDTPEVLRQYAKLFRADDRRLALPDRPAATRSSRSSPPGGCGSRPVPTGALDHPSRIFLLDPRGHQREIYNLEFLTPQAVLQDVREPALDEPR